MDILADLSPHGIASLGRNTFDMETLNSSAVSSSEAAPEIRDRNSRWTTAIFIHPILIVNKKCLRLAS